MQVKKFEARTMKEALEMVKKQLGPEAIILGARDNRKSYGLVGEGSIEVTAAISEEVLQRKKITESKMRTQDKERFQSSPAKVQKQVMERFVQKHIEERQPRPAPTRARYIDIEDESYAQEMGSGGADPAAQERIKSAAQRAWNAMHTYADEPAQRPAPQTSAPARRSTNENKTSEIAALQTEILGLKHALAQFQKVPQGFAGTHPGAEYGLSYEFSSTFEKLVKAGISTEYAGEMLKLAQEQMPPIRYKNKALVDAWTARHLMELTQVTDPAKQNRVQIFLGPSGSGKTAAMVKLAAHATITERKKVVLLTTDSFKVGAADQLRTYAQILNVPFAILRKQSDWTYLLSQLSGYDLILCDYPGLSLKSVEEISLLRSLLPPDSVRHDTHLVLSATAKNDDLYEVGRRYRVSHFTDAIFTGLDQSNQHGSLFNFSKHFSVPLHSFGLGSRVPDDFELATKERMLDLIFKLSKIKSHEEAE